MMLLLQILLHHTGGDSEGQEQAPQQLSENGMQRFTCGMRKPMAEHATYD